MLKALMRACNMALPSMTYAGTRTLPGKLLASGGQLNRSINVIVAAGRTEAPSYGRDRPRSGEHRDFGGRGGSTGERRDFGGRGGPSGGRFSGGRGSGGRFAGGRGRDDAPRRDWQARDDERSRPSWNESSSGGGGGGGAGYRTEWDDAGPPAGARPARDGGGGGERSFANEWDAPARGGRGRGDGGGYGGRFGDRAGGAPARFAGRGGGDRGRPSFGDRDRFDRRGGEGREGPRSDAFREGRPGGGGYGRGREVEREAEETSEDWDREEEDYDGEGGGEDSYGRRRSSGGGRGGPPMGMSWREWKDQQPRNPTIRDDLWGSVIYGVAPVTTALTVQRRQLHCLYVQDNLDFAKRKDAAQIKAALATAEKLGVSVRNVSKHELNLLSDDRPHQGLLLDCSPLEWVELDQLPDPAEAAAAAAGRAPEGDNAPAAPRPPVWLALDEVVDPQNLGALVRAAYCLGASGLLAVSKNCAPLSATTTKASAGVLEAWPVHSCDNLPRTLADAAGRGWLVLGAAGERGAVPCRSVVIDRPTVLVVGSEGFGLRTNVRRACEQLVKVEMALAAGDRVVDSLNVSVATGILLHHLINAAPAAAAAPEAAAGSS